MATNTAASFSTPTANGTAGPFNIGFNYLAQSEIDVTVDGVLKTLNTHYIFHSTTQISFTSGNFPTVGQTIKFQRNTDISAKKVDFVDGSVLTETDLDNNTDQILFGLQEFVDELNTNVVKRDGTQTITTNLVFEGSSDDANETTLGVVNPTADRTINLPNVSGTVVTTGDTGTVSNGMIADDAVNAAKISEADLKSLSNCQTGSAASLANLTNNEVSILDGATVSTTELNTLDGVNSTLTASELNVLDGITASTANLNQLTNKEIETSLTANSDAKIPTSKAVNDRILTVTNALGGFVAIANETSFPSTHPDPSGNAGTVVSISDAGGVVINSSGVATISNGAGSGNTVTITGFPSDLHSRTLGSGVGLQVQTTSTLHTYTYHKSLIKESDLVNFSADLDSFRSRYRVVDTTPTSNNDEGDLIFRKSDNKLLVFNGTAYQEASSVGNFHTNTLSSFNGTGGGSATFNGSAYRFNINHPPELAEQLLVSINGIIQKPNNGSSQPSEGFALSGSSVIFSAAPASGSDFFIITIGKSVDIGVVSDGTIDNAKVASDASIEGTKINPNFGSQNIITSGTVDGRDVSADGTKLDGIEANAINASNTAITNKLPLAGGTLTGNLTISNSAPQLNFTDTGHNPDYSIKNFNGKLEIKDETNNSIKLAINSDGHIDITAHTDFQAGLDVTGDLTVSEHIALPDNKRLKLGAAENLQIFHTSGNGFIKNGTGNLHIRPSSAADEGIIIKPDSAVELYYDNVKRFETTSTGITARGTQHLFTSETSGDCELIIQADSDNNNEGDNPRLIFRQDGSLNLSAIGHNFAGSEPSGNKLFIANSVSNGGIEFYTNDTADNYIYGVKRLEITSNGNIQIPVDNAKLQIGAGQDLEIFHNGGDSKIINKTGNLTLNSAATTGAIDIIGSTGQVKLLYGGSSKLETTSTGATVTTTSAANSIKNITTSTSAPSGGSDGDLWFTYIA